MPPARIHEAVALELNKKRKYNEILLRIGTIAPDSWRNANPKDGKKNKYKTHFWDFSIKEGQANDYKRFYTKYHDNMDNPFYFGYLVHLIVDQYWKTHIDPKYRIENGGTKGFILRNGTFHDDNNWWGYYDSLKMERNLAKIYNLTKLPIEKEKIKNFNCDIEELDQSGLFGKEGTLNYVNEVVSLEKSGDESEIYDINDVLEYIKETTDFVDKEIKKLE